MGYGTAWGTEEIANNADQSGKEEDLDEIHQLPSTKDQQY